MGYSEIWNLIHFFISKLADENILRFNIPVDYAFIVNIWEWKTNDSKNSDNFFLSELLFFFQSLIKHSEKTSLATLHYNAGVGSFILEPVYEFNNEGML